MTYAARADLAARWGEQWLLQRESMLPANACAQALADASAEIDSYLRGRYALPLVNVPADVVRLCCCIARYRLLGDTAGADSVARLEYQDAVKDLLAIANGTKTLVDAAGNGPDGQTAAANAFGLAKIAPGRRVFGGREYLL
jgi:phage gp36-like protein